VIVICNIEARVVAARDLLVDAVRNG